MEMMIDRTDEATDKYKLMSDGIVAEIEDKLFMIFTYGPESRYYLADIHANRIVAAISMVEGSKCVLACDDMEGWRIVVIDENGNNTGSIKLCRTGIDLGPAGETMQKRAAKNGDVARVTESDFREADDHGTNCRRDRDLRQTDEGAEARQIQDI